MSQESPDTDLVDVVFFGILQPGKDRETAIDNLARLFKTDAEKLKPLFSGGRKVIKGNIPGATAEKYITALENVGLVVKTEAATGNETSNGQAETPDNNSSEASAASQNKGQDTDDNSGNDTNPNSLSMAEVGADVLPHPPEKPVQKIEDFSFLTLAETGADVLEHPVEVTPQEIGDISALKLEDPS